MAWQANNNRTLTMTRIKAITRTRLFGSIVAASAFLISSGWAQTSVRPASQPSEEDFLAFDQATTGDVRDVLRAAEAGDVAAQYAVSLIALHGLQGRPVSLEVSASFLTRANSQPPFETETVTRIVPGPQGERARASVVERSVNARVQAYSRAYIQCIGEILGTRQDLEACGTNAESRERRKAAWREASADRLR